MSKEFFHISVMYNEVMSFFDNAQGKILIDATAGKGGHLQGLVEKAGQSGRVFAFDKDERAHKEDAAFGVAEKNPTIVRLLKKTFSLIPNFLRQEKIKADGLICDLGVSSEQLSDPQRGFSFLNDGPIDMRMNQQDGLTAYEWLKISDEKTIADALYNYGEEKKSRHIASLIKKSWPIPNSTVALASLITRAVRQKKWSKIHPATRSFQAIRIAVNKELLELKMLLDSLDEILNENAVAVFISFHSLEDRMVKQKFKELEKEGKFKILTKKPLVATDEEININPRSRSAKLRAIKKINV